MLDKVEEQREFKLMINNSREGNKIQNDEILEINKQGRYNKEDFDNLVELHKHSFSKDLRRNSKVTTTFSDNLSSKSTNDTGLNSNLVRKGKRMTIQASMIASVFQKENKGGRGRIGSLYTNDAMIDQAKSN